METEVETAMTLKDKIDSKTAKLGVIGMGYVGLPLAVEMAAAGFHVTGFDTKTEVIEGLNRRESHILDVPSERIAQYIEEGSVVFTTETATMAEMDVLAICVPTPLDPKTKTPNLGYVRSATESVAAYLRQGQLIVLESTTYPGTTEEVLLPILSRNGMKVGEDFYLAFSPERVDPGNTRWQTKNTPKVLGGVTDQCTEHAAAVYRHFIDTIVTVSSPRVAEMTKLLENTYRAVNIALVSELLLLCDRMGIDIWEVIEAAKTKPFGFEAFYPGPGLGGHCIPIDPFYLSWKAKEFGFPTEFIDLAGRINERMPYHVRQKVVEALNGAGQAVKGARILVLGVAYKRDISDFRESPALRIIPLLEEWGGIVQYCDMHVARLEWKHDDKEDGAHPDMLAVESSEESIRESDCVVVVTDHSHIDYADLASRAKLVVDCRNACPRAGNVVKI